MSKCGAVRPDGTPCGNRPLRGGQFCRWHENGATRIQANTKPTRVSWDEALLLDQKATEDQTPENARGALEAWKGVTRSRTEAQSRLAYAHDRAAHWLRQIGADAELHPVAVDVPKKIIYAATEEVRTCTEGISHGHTGEGWMPVDDGAARVYRNPSRGSYYLHLTVPPPIETWGLPERSAYLDEILRTWNFDTAFLNLIVIGTLADITLHHADAVKTRQVAPIVALRVDDLLKSLGKAHKGREQWNELRTWVGNTLYALSHLTINGQRRGKWLSDVTGKVENFRVYDSMFEIRQSGTKWLDGQLALDGSAIPLQFTVAGGDFFARMAENPRILQHLGDLRKLAEIPAGKAGGQWARVMALAYAQFAREQVNRPKPKKLLTRSELLTRFAPVPTVQSILGGPNPSRVLQYWREAKAELIRIGWWSAFDEPPKPTSRFGWGEEWLAQEVTPIPGPILLGPLEDLADRGNTIRKRLKRSRTSTGPMKQAE